MNHFNKEEMVEKVLPMIRTDARNGTEEGEFLFFSKDDEGTFLMCSNDLICRYCPMYNGGCNSTQILEEYFEEFLV